MQLTLANKSILAAGFLSAAAAVIVFKSQPAPIKGVVSDAPGTGLPQRSANSRAVRPDKPTGRPIFSGDSNSEPPTFLPALAELASSNPKKALANLASIEDPDQLSLALAAIASGWAQLDPTEAAKWVAGLPSASQRGDAETGLIAVWAASAPVDCLAWATGHPAGPLRDEALVKVAETWRSNDPQEALGRFLALENDDGGKRGLHAIVSQWATDDPPAAVEHVSALEKSPRRDELLQVALVSLATQDPELAWNYSDRFSDQKFTEQVRGTALQAMAATRPHEALELAGTGGNSEVLLAGIARGWAAADDDAVDEWIASLPDQDLAARLRAEASR